jgi:hypothetical protein
MRAGTWQQLQCVLTGWPRDFCHRFSMRRPYEKHAAAFG